MAQRKEFTRWMGNEAKKAAAKNPNPTFRFVVGAGADPDEVHKIVMELLKCGVTSDQIIYAEAEAEAA